MKSMATLGLTGILATTLISCGDPSKRSGGSLIAGRDGRDGEDGEDGKTGKTGATGEKGAKGDKGEKGETGATGEKGDKGDKGQPGTPGTQGLPGVPGAQGAQGPQGLPGAKGVPGPAGVLNPQNCKPKFKQTNITSVSAYYGTELACGSDEFILSGGCYVSTYPEAMRAYESHPMHAGWGGFLVPFDSIVGAAWYCAATPSSNNGTHYYSFDIWAVCCKAQ